MQSATSYGFVADVTGGAQPVHVSGVFSAPDHIHETVTVGGSTLELIRIGSRTFSRNAPTGAWTAATPTSTSGPGDPRSAFSPLASAMASSAEGSTYGFTLSDADAAQLVQGSTSVTGSAVVAGGYITDLRYQSTSPPVSVHITYTGINSTPAVTAPPT
jgi:hypothetical protein